MRCAQPAVRMGHCARRRVSERNRRTAAALGAEIDTRPTLLPVKGLFDKRKSYIQPPSQPPRKIVTIHVKKVQITAMLKKQQYSIAKKKTFI